MTHKHKDGGHVLQVGTLARVEGEGAMHIAYRDGVVTDVLLRMYEPPRFYEAFLRGRSYTEPPDITARICGICPVAYQMSSCWAVEDACGVGVTEEIQALRRLLYCGEWIASHALQERVRTGRPIRHQAPRIVEEYICARGLYRAGA